LERPHAEFAAEREMDKPRERRDRRRKGRDLRHRPGARSQAQKSHAAHPWLRRKDRRSGWPRGVNLRPVNLAFGRKEAQIRALGLLRLTPRRSIAIPRATFDHASHVYAQYSYRNREAHRRGRLDPPATVAMRDQGP